MGLKLANNATSTLATSIDDSASALDVQSADASKFPTLSAGDWFPITVVDASGNIEVMKCTARSGTTLTVTRAQEGTSALAFDAGARVDLRVTKSTLENLFETMADATAKNTPVDNDVFGILDSAASYIPKKLTLANLKTTLQSTFLRSSQNLADVDDAETARENLGATQIGDALFTAEDAAAARATIGLATTGLFIKADPRAVAFTKTGAGTVSIKAGTVVEVDGVIYEFGTDTAVSMPALTAGTDYAIWIKPDGSLEATTDHVSPPLAGSRKLGGFHYAPGGNATAFNTGGDTTPQINEFSIWDIKFRPACPDPRGMALVANAFWCDIYLLGVNHHTDGTSRYNVTIADGSSPPKVPALFGGNGSTAYGSLTWWEAAEVMASHGKQLLSYAEFAAATFGTKEAQAGGTDPVSTILRADYTSKWGIMLATGNMWVWGRDFGGPYGSAAYAANTGGRGSTYNLSNVAILGGHWDGGADAGSRASPWNNPPSSSYDSIGARGRCDHLNHV